MTKGWQGLEGRVGKEGEDSRGILYKKAHANRVCDIYSTAIHILVSHR